MLYFEAKTIQLWTCSIFLGNQNLIFHSFDEKRKTDREYKSQKYSTAYYFDF